MTEKQIYDTAEKVSDSIANSLGIDRETTVTIIEMFLERLIDCLRAEVPFTINGFGKFFFKYAQAPRPNEQQAHYLSGKVRKSLEFKLSTMMEAELAGWVHDLGIKSNEKCELAKMKIRPEEIDKIRRKKVLEEQRSLGFRSDLLFEDPPIGDRHIEANLGDPPSVDDLIRRIGLNLRS